MKDPMLNNVVRHDLRHKDPEILIEYAIKNLIHNHSRTYRGRWLWVLVRDVSQLGKLLLKTYVKDIKLIPG